jgi:hypothetical protein
MGSMLTITPPRELDSCITLCGRKSWYHIIGREQSAGKDVYNRHEIAGEW